MLLLVQIGNARGINIVIFITYGIYTLLIFFKKLLNELWLIILKKNALSFFTFYIYSL